MSTQAPAPATLSSTSFRTRRTLGDLRDHAAQILDALGIDAVEDIHMEAGMRCRFDSRADVQVVASGVHEGARWCLELYLQERGQEREFFIFALGDDDPSHAEFGIPSGASVAASETVRAAIIAQLIA